MDVETRSIPAQQIPSYEARKEAGEFVKLSADVRRLRWSLNGPLATSIQVMKDRWVDPDPDAAPPEPYCQQEDDGTIASWHAVAQSPYTEPKVSSVTIRVDPLEHWEMDWLEMNEPYPNDPDGSCAVGERPVDKDARLEVKAAGEFLTIHDYVSAVHPWLMGLRGDLLAALALTAAGQDDPLPPETRLMAVCGWPDEVEVLREQDWLAEYTKPASKVPELATSAGPARYY
ncbi:hypothetical protein N656DRAFT_831756 [Canariomyces notabilis]|jgi:hypothetical protein|uniref:Uncharacterized protein n=1 Tax=Canariomyces notabilis TaxID=2074819 RepID=A0AAN6T9A0_9PEZI|nr:hypothetical protein N656DRAFT_831756 [Canariomyces arenarius]